MNDLDLWESLVFYKCVSVQAEIVAAAVFVTSVCHCHNDIFFTPTYPAASQIYPCICLVAERESFNSLSCDPLLFLRSQKIGRLRIVIIMFLCFCNSFLTSQKFVIVTLAMLCYELKDFWGSWWKHCDIDITEMLLSWHLRMKCRGSLLRVKKMNQGSFTPESQRCRCWSVSLGFIYLN